MWFKKGKPELNYTCLKKAAKSFYFLLDFEDEIVRFLNIETCVELIKYPNIVSPSYPIGKSSSSQN